MRWITFSLFGKDPKYLVGAIKNAEQIKQFYPGFRAIFYTAHDVPQDCIKRLRELGAIVIRGLGSQLPNPMFLRLAAVSKPDAEIVLCRDADSRFSIREVDAVNAWLASDRLFHIIRDYPAHDTVIMGGTWGWRKPLKLKLYQDAVNWFRDRRIVIYEKMQDQKFLAEIVWPQVRHTVFQHDSFFRDKYPESVMLPGGDWTEDGSFIGEIIDEFEQPELISREARLRGEKAG